MRSNWIAIAINTVLFVNIAIVYFLIHTINVSLGEISHTSNAALTPVPTREDTGISQTPSEVAVVEEVASPSGDITITPTPATMEEKIEHLKASIDAVNNKVEALKRDRSGSVVSNQPAVFEVSNSFREITIHFGSGQTSSKEWVDIPGMNAYIDSRNYPNVSSIRFEAVARIPTASGYVHVRVYNETADHPVWNSEVVSETDEARLLESGPIVLDGGNNLYQVQMRSTIGHLAIIDSGRIKIYAK